MIRNIDLLKSVHSLIISEPDKHRQGLWASVPADAITHEAFVEARTLGEDGIAVSCATACCVAGWACMLSGDKAYVYEHDLTAEASPVPGKRHYSIDSIITEAGTIDDIDQRAQALLGVTYDESELLFNGGNSQEYTLELLDALINGEQIVDKYGDPLI